MNETCADQLITTVDSEIVDASIEQLNAVALSAEDISADQYIDSAIVRANTEEYVISSGGMYGGGDLVGAIPTWLMQAIQQQLSTGDGNITSVINDMKTLLDSLSIGVSQVISSLNSLSESTSSITTALSSKVDNNRADLLNILSTKVDEQSAQSIAADAIRSKFGDNVESYIGNIASTYVDQDSAIAQEIGLLQSSLDGVNASVTDISNATVEYVLNPLWIDDGNQTDPDVNGEPQYVLQAKAKKQLQVDANGVITGLLLESGTTSSITMQADEFKLVATGQSVASRNPFTVDAATGNITFDGVVDFTNTNLDGTTTIDGGKITTGTITANAIAANTITADKIQAVNINGYTIEGSVIKGASIEGSVIKSSWIDYTTTGDLTNWQFYTPDTIPSAYAANFAHNNTTGALIIDSSGYVRLPGKTKCYSVTGTSNDGIAAYDSYTISTANRAIVQYPRLTSTSVGLILSVTPPMNVGYSGNASMTVLNIPVSMTAEFWAGGGGSGIRVKLTINGATTTYSANATSPLRQSFSVAGISFLLTTALTNGGHDYTAYLSMNINSNVLLSSFVSGSAFIIGNFSSSGNASSAGRPSYYVTQ